MIGKVDPAAAAWATLAVVVTVVAFLPSLDNGFTNWDDPQYVTDNAAVRGVSERGYGPAVHGVIGGNYHPLTMLTLAWDHQRATGAGRGDLSARPFHVTSLVLHAANTALVFLLAYLLAGRRVVVAAVTAALFGVHPMHVESVAWVSGRKDVLYAFFSFVALLAYLEYRRAPRAWPYVASLAAFACSLLSKSAAVVLPVVLVLVDDLLDGTPRRRPWIEKVPFFALAIAMGIATVRLQAASGAVGDVSYGWLERIVVAGYAFASYWIKLIVPTGLSALHPLPQGLTFAHFALAAVGVGIGLVALACYARCKVVFFGVAFFAVNVALVLQLFPVGAAVIAERYTYVSAVGIFFLAGVGLDLVMKRLSGAPRVLTIAVAAVLVLAAAWASQARIAVWRDSQTLWTDVIDRYPDTAFKAYAARGADLKERGDLGAALRDLDRAIELAPVYGNTYLTRANVFRELSREHGDATLLARSLEDLGTALSLEPRNADLYHARALTYYHMRRPDEALGDFAAALEIEPSLAGAYLDRARLFLALGRLESALDDYTAYVGYRPDDPVGLLLRADTALALGRLDDAEADFTRCIETFSRFGDCYLGRGRVREKLGRFDEAQRDLARSNELAEGGGP